MTYNELVREYLPNATDEECDFILWEKTAFPMCDIEKLKEQLEDYVNIVFENGDEYKPNCCDCEFTYDSDQCDGV